jgi:hypothetical protein
MFLIGSLRSWVAILAVSLCAIANGQSTKPTTQAALRLTVADNGDVSLSLEGNPVATGHWSLFRADWTGLAADQVSIGTLTSSTARQDSATHATITDNYTNAKTTTELQLDGEDLRIKTHLENHDAKLSLKNVAFHGLVFRLAHEGQGTIPSFHSSYLAAHGDFVFHPGLPEPIGVVYAQDGQYGFSAHSRSEFDRLSLINVNFQKEGTIPALSNIEFYTRRVVPAGQAVDVDINFRVSRDFSIPHLFEDYKKVYDQHFPKLLYNPDDRTLGECVAADKSAVSPVNPLGFLGGMRRLDTLAGTWAYIRLAGPPLQNTDALGIIFWAPTGYSEPMYPPDFDAFPKSVEDNIPALVAGFKKHNLRVGLCARCGDGVTRVEGKEPQMYRLDASNPEQMKTLMARFDHAMKLGFSLFYLDSFGVTNPNDQAILKLVREKVGPDVQLYTEFVTDMSLPYAGHYCEWQGTYIRWTNDYQYQGMRYLCPDSTWACLSRTKQPIPPEFDKLGLTPIVNDVDFARLPRRRPLK